MAKQRTDKCNYPSRYSPGMWVTPQQYIIELVCGRKGKALGIDLPTKFWDQPEWSTFYRSQLRHCRMLLKKYDEKSIIRALEGNRGSKIYSLFVKWLEPLIVIEQEKLEAERVKMEQRDVVPDLMTPVTESVVPRKRMLTALDKLRELNGEKEGGG